MKPRTFKLFYQNSISGNLLNSKLVHASCRNIDKLLALGLAQRLKNSDLILESKMVELNQNKKSNKQLD